MSRMRAGGTPRNRPARAEAACRQYPATSTAMVASVVVVTCTAPADDRRTTAALTTGSPARATATLAGAGFAPPAG